MDYYFQGLAEKPASMDEIIEEMAEMNRRAQKPPLALVRTFGCQMNAHDSEKLETMLFRMGYAKADSEQSADLVLINTCCVRENAENRMFGHLGKLKEIKRGRPKLIVAVCGCITQQEAVVEKIKKSYSNVDIMFGTFNLDRFPELLRLRLSTGKQAMEILKEPDKDFEGPFDYTIRHFPFKASVNIMHGCDNRCSYCIVPQVRGRERSRPPEDIMDEVGKLAASGVKEIMLLGQNVNSYGKGLNETFSGLLDRVCGISGIERVRFMTSHPKDLSDDLVRTIKRQNKMAKHLHLPVQSGSTKILAAMNRKYTKEDYLALVSGIRESIPEISITTDFIVGFPGETEEDFNETLDLVKLCRFSGAFTFLYSKRSGTPAASMPGQVESDVASSRFKLLLNAINGIEAEERQKSVGKTMRVLVEAANEKDPSLLTGRSECNSVVHFKGDASLIGQFADVLITSHKTFYLFGEQTG
jgi:tRNA-2-methylthio-N6-dimethylallyladenosine synthase